MSTKVVLLEVASVIAIIGSIAAIAIPKTAQIQSAREAETVALDVETVRAAVYAFHADSTYFPPEAARGDIPVGLEPYLPPRFSFRRPWGMIEYKNWPASVRFGTTVAQADSVVTDSIVSDRVVRDTVIASRIGVPVDSALAELAPMTKNPLVRVPTITSSPPAAVAEAPRDSVVSMRVIGVSVTSRDPRAAVIAAQRARRMARFIVGDKVTFVLFGA